MPEVFFFVFDLFPICFSCCWQIGSGEDMTDGFTSGPLQRGVFGNSQPPDPTDPRTGATCILLAGVTSDMSEFVGQTADSLQLLAVCLLSFLCRCEVKDGFKFQAAMHNLSTTH